MSEEMATAEQATIPVIAVVLLELAMAVAAAAPRTLKWRMHHGIQLSSTLAQPTSDAVSQGIPVSARPAARRETASTSPAGLSWSVRTALCAQRTSSSFAVALLQAAPVRPPSRQKARHVPWPLIRARTPREHAPALPAARAVSTQARATSRQPGTAIQRLPQVAQSKRRSSASPARARSCRVATAATVPNTKLPARAVTGSRPASCRSVVARRLHPVCHPGPIRRSSQSGSSAYPCGQVAARLSICQRFVVRVLARLLGLSSP